MNWLSTYAVVGTTAIYDAVTNSIVFEAVPDGSDGESANPTTTIVIICAVIVVVIAAAIIISIMQKRKKRGQQA